ncbi:hypothetical protein AJ80_08481 [Polytolypa hystricis UAMH7299]|uniref:Uncharacterized protein n=1 Tax=Polytolypa hystricis (strain UAMH7299) TaxID=1447883 RepID=A0A2B7X7E6_POLH7|nr:hypothetical protein AJ80_08481 [Polytolypa hystricis UAMH7299]
MSFCRHARRRALQQQRPTATTTTLLPSADHIWISDSVLAQLFAQFASRGRYQHQQQKRHGSSVPGPLEANRRLARRRAMDIAAAGCGGGAGNMDIAALFGRYYQGPQRNEGQIPPLGGFWPFKQQEAIPPRAQINSVAVAEADTSEFYELSDPDIFQETLSPADIAGLEGELKSRILEASSMEDIRQIIFDLRLDLREYPTLSNSILCGLIAKVREGGGDIWIAACRDFLRDHSLNIGGAGNYAAFVTKFLIKVRVPREYVKEDLTFIKQSLALGLLTVDEIDAIVKFIPVIKGGTDKGVLFDSDRETLVFCYQAIWDGLSACPVLQARDLRGNTLKFWLDDLQRVAPTPGILSIAKVIARTLESAKLSASPPLWTSDLLIRRLILTMNPGLDGVLLKTPREQDLLQALDYVEAVLGLFPPDAVVRYIARVTETMVFSPRYASIRADLLPAWTWVLRRLENTQRLHDSKAWVDLESRSAAGKNATTGLDSEILDVSFDQKRLLRLWVLRMAGNTTPAYRQNRIPLLAVFESVLDNIYASLDNSNEKKTKPQTLVRMSVAELSSRGLPGTKFVLSEITRIEYMHQWREETGRLATTLQEEFQTIPSSCSKDLIHVASNYKFYTSTSSKADRYSIFDRLARETDLSSPTLVGRLLYHIEQGNLPLAVMFRLLRRHTAFKLALSMTGTHSHAHIPTPRSHSSLPSSTSKVSSSSPTTTATLSPPNNPTPQPPPSTLTHPSPTDCLDTISLLAIYISCSTRLTPRMAWRKVHWCYAFLHSRGAPIPPAIVRALYHAGVVRYRETDQRIARRKMAWLVGLVREVEGREVADALAEEPFYA